MKKYLVLSLLLTAAVKAAGDYGIFPTETDLNMTADDYWQLSGALGMVCGYIFWEKLFR